MIYHDFQQLLIYYNINETNTADAVLLSCQRKNTWAALVSAWISGMMFSESHSNRKLEPKRDPN